MKLPPDRFRQQKLISMKFHKGTLFIANGKWFISLEAVEKYAKENNWRIVNIKKQSGKRNNFPYQAIVTIEAA